MTTKTKRPLRTDYVNGKEEEEEEKGKEDKEEGEEEC